MAIINDGFSTTISFAEDADVQMKEKEVTPPGVEGGGANDTSTMHNTTWRTRQPKSLRTLSECSFTAAYDPAVYDEIVAMINVNQLITLTFPDGETLAFWGWLDVFTPGASKEGEQPTADVTIIPSNQNDSGVETAPVLA
uniref:Tail protein n=3 Tax=viral metagenome TaxID=1070528 RepID=A0A6M3K439_9ZZZZ